MLTCQVVCYSTLLSNFLTTSTMTTMTTMTTTISLLLNHVHQLQVGDQVGSVQWTRDGLTLGYDRDLPGFDRYYVLGNDEAGTYNLQVCISKKLCQHDLK